MEERIESIINNARFMGYCEYVIRDTKDKKALYKIFLNQLKQNHYRYTKDIPNIIICFHEFLNDEPTIYQNYLYYDFLFNKTEESLIRLHSLSDHKQYIDELLTHTQDKELLEKIYACLERVDDLYQLISQQDKDYLYIRNIDVLKEKYAQNLYERFSQRFYSILEEGMGREIYHRAAKYASYIAQLDDNKDYYHHLIEELRNSKHSKKPALFDELSKVG
jgi:hypothetical protein